MVYWTEEGDPDVFKASKLAQKTFRYFWREAFWERRRIVPAYDRATAKLAFIGPSKASKKEQAIEFMWVDDVNFDGVELEGTLLNAPVELRGLRQGERVSLPLDQLSDWMLVRNGKAIGAFTVNAMRRRMTPRDRAAHDAAWGLEFGRPAMKPKLEPFACMSEHPMAKNVVTMVERQLGAGEVKARHANALGWSLLHDYALAGATGIVRALLRHGADPLKKTAGGLRPSELADSLKWKSTATLLRRAEAKQARR